MDTCPEAEEGDHFVRVIVDNCLSSRDDDLLVLVELVGVAADVVQTVLFARLPVTAGVVHRQHQVHLTASPDVLHEGRFLFDQATPHHHGACLFVLRRH